MVLEAVLRLHGETYPRMTPQDGVKLVYQHTFGGGHLIRDPGSCLARLRQEWSDTPKDPAAPLTEPIGNGLTRVNLASPEADPELLGPVFLKSAETHRGSLEDFLPKLEILRQMTDGGFFGFSLPELDAYLEEYRKAGYPMVSHSETYRKAYRPAYRVVREDLLE